MHVFVLSVYILFIQPPQIQRSETKSELKNKGGHDKCKG